MEGGAKEKEPTENWYGPQVVYYLENERISRFLLTKVASLTPIFYLSSVGGGQQIRQYAPMVYKTEQNRSKDCRRNVFVEIGAQSQVQLRIFADEILAKSSTDCRYQSGSCDYFYVIGC